MVTVCASEVQLFASQYHSISQLISQVTQAIKNNEDVAIFWSILSAGWDEGSAAIFLDMVIDMWITIR